MPFYEYECSNCKFYVEAMQKISDAPLKECPSCGQSTLVRLISAPVFRLKGGGWYETDFKSDKEPKRNLSGSDSSEGDSKASKDEPAKTKAPRKARTSAVKAKQPPAATTGSTAPGAARKKKAPAGKPAAKAAKGKAVGRSAGKKSKGGAARRKAAPKGKAATRGKAAGRSKAASRAKVARKATSKVATKGRTARKTVRKPKSKPARRGR